MTVFLACNKTSSDINVEVWGKEGGLPLCLKSEVLGIGLSMVTLTALLWEMQNLDDCINRPFIKPHSVRSNARLTASLWSYYRCFLEHYRLRHVQIQLFFTLLCSCLSQVFKVVGWWVNSTESVCISIYSIIFCILWFFLCDVTIDLTRPRCENTQTLTHPQRERESAFMCTSDAHQGKK